MCTVSKNLSDALGGDSDLSYRTPFPYPAHLKRLQLLAVLALAAAGARATVLGLELGRAVASPLDNVRIIFSLIDYLHACMIYFNFGFVRCLSVLGEKSTVK